jgi:hypothetical protein
VVFRQLKAINAEQKKQRHATKNHYEFKIFNIVRKYVSFPAINAAFKQMQIAKAISINELSKCSGGYTKSLGLPCKHVIRAKLDTKEPL